MPDFARFDTRHYPTVSAREGYREWTPTYEATVEDAMDLALLEKVKSIAWNKASRVADLGCGTGRTGAWLESRGARGLDGVDLTPEMLAVARGRELYERLVEGDVTATGLPGHAYDLVTCCLVDEHLPTLGPLYTEAGRLLRRVLPIVMGGIMFLQNKLNPQTVGDPAQQKMMTYLPIIFTFMFLNFPAGLVLYWLTNSVLNFGQQMVIKRRMGY